MADEQTIYLSPEEELTNVRERLGKTQARKIVLVIPPQTQLRSHVGWRLIYADMREMNKELLVISPDRQVRAVAKSVGFKVAEPNEVPNSRTRSASPTRPTNTKGLGRSRVGGPPANRTLQSPTSRRPPSQALGKRPPAQPLRSVPDFDDEDTTEERPGKPEREPDQNSPLISLPPFREDEERFGPSHNFNISTISPRSPTPLFEDENEDEDANLKHDYDFTNTLRQAAGSGNVEQVSNIGETESQLPNMGEKESQLPAPGRWEDDLYTYMEDDQQLAPLPEQKGSAPGPVEEINPGIVDISDKSTEIMPGEIEYLGDQGDIDLPEVKPMPERNTQLGQPREQSARPRRQSGPMPPKAISRHLPRSPRPNQDLDEDDDLLPIPDRPTRGAVGPGTSRSSRNLKGTGQRSSQPIEFRQARRISQPIAPVERRQSQPISHCHRPERALVQQ